MLNTLSWWMYPFKPVRTTKAVFKTINTSNYTMETKLDGWRIINILNGTPKLFTRQKKKIQAPSDLMDQLAALQAPKGTVFDGEIWTQKKKGGWHKCEPGECRITLWDIIRIGKTDLSKEPIEKRREILGSLMKEECPSIKQVEILEASLEECERINQEAIEMRKAGNSKHGFIHGVVLKKNGSIRRDHCSRSTKHPDWLKILFDGMEGWEPDLNGY